MGKKDSGVFAAPNSANVLYKTKNKKKKLDRILNFKKGVARTSILMAFMDTISVIKA